MARKPILDIKIDFNGESLHILFFEIGQED